jgi:hypothetical protein
MDASGTITVSAGAGGEQETADEAITVNGAAPPPPPPPPPPPTGGSVVVNGDFEAGLSGWQTDGNVTSVAGAHGQGAQVGGMDGAAGSNSLYQLVQLPDDASTLSFSFTLRCSDTFEWDQQAAFLLDQDGWVIDTIFYTCEDDGGSWRTATDDVSWAAGQSVYIYFETDDDGNPADPTWMAIDDVSVN